MAAIEILEAASKARPVPAFATFPANRLQSSVARLGSVLPNNWLGKRVSGWLRWLLETTAHQPVDVYRLGFRMRLHLSGNASEKRLMVTPHFFDPVDLDLLATHIDRVERNEGRPFCFVDVGANAGTYTLFVAHHAQRRPHILSIEPNPAMLERLRANLLINDCRTRIAACAVGDRSGRVSFHINRKNAGSSSALASEDGRGMDVLSVECRTLLELVTEAELPQIDAMKLDIEGYEDKALVPFLADAPEALWPTMIILEPNTQQWATNVLTALQAKGWTISPGKTKNVVLFKSD